MKKKILLRCLIGMTIGMSINTIISIMISLAIGDGKFYPVVPELITKCGNEINAVLLQTVCSLLYGAACAGSSVVWDKENWSLLKQTIAHLVICSLATFPAAYFTYWMPHSLSGVLVYFGIFFGIYLIIWISIYLSIKKRVTQLNKKINENKTNFHSPLYK